MPSTGVLMRVLEMKGDEYSVDEISLQPGVVTNWQRFLDTSAEHQAVGGEGEIEIAGPEGIFGSTDRKPLSPIAATIVDQGQWHRIINSGLEPLILNMTLRPTWNPKRAIYYSENQEFLGNEVWFEVKTYLNDQITRAKYNLHDLSAQLGTVSVRLEPRTESIETFHQISTATITGGCGSGTIRIDGQARDLRTEDQIVVKPLQRYQLINNTDKVWEVNQIHEPQWEPQDTYYVQDLVVIPGNLAWFEFFLPPV